MNPVLVGSKVICSLLSCFVFVVGSFKHAGDHHCFKYKSFIN